MEGKNVAVLVEFNYEDLELWYPLLRFREEGAKTFTVGPKAGVKYAGKHSCERSSQHRPCSTSRHTCTLAAAGTIPAPSHPCI
jgi:protease I